MSSGNEETNALNSEMISFLPKMQMPIRNSQEASCRGCMILFPNKKKKHQQKYLTIPGSLDASSSLISIKLLWSTCLCISIASSFILDSSTAKDLWNTSARSFLKMISFSRQARVSFSTYNCKSNKICQHSNKTI